MGYKTTIDKTAPFHRSVIVGEAQQYFVNSKKYLIEAVYFHLKKMFIYIVKVFSLEETSLYIIINWMNDSLLLRGNETNRCVTEIVTKRFAQF